MLGDLHEHGVDVLEATLEVLVALQDLLFGRLQDRVQPAEDRQREDDLAVLRLLVVPPKEVGDRPDEGDLLLEVVHPLALLTLPL